ncbi:MAG: SAM-dependent methyltransferase [bacterium]
MSGEASGFTLEAVGPVVGGRGEVEDDDWGGVRAQIVLADAFDASALDGIEGFSHLEVVFLMHRVDPAKVERRARRPRNLGHLPPIGIFAQRPKARPNRLGVSRCALVGREGRALWVEGLDAVDGTPVLDIKPWFSAFGPRGAVREPGWVGEIVGRYF